MRSTAPRVSPDEIEFIQGGTRSIENGRRLYWHIYHGGNRAGSVSIDFSEEGTARDASINVQLNQRSRGRGIGTVAFRRACELSGLKEIVASIRKGNIGSRIAAERAGFIPLENQPSGELLMVWRRP